MKSQEQISMLAQERKAYLLEILAKTGRIVARDVSTALAVSEDTIRRDLREMAKEGKLKRVHGGAVQASPALADVAGRRAIASPEKARIGAAASCLVEPGQLVFIDGGTTAEALAGQIHRDLEATVVTHSPSIALALVGHPRITVDMIGGRLFRHSIVATGAQALSAIDRYRPDICFIGVTGVHPREGLTTGDSEEAEIKRAIMRRSGETVILASSEKLGAVSAFVVVPCDEADRIVVSAPPPAELSTALADLGCEFVIAK